jgi:ATP-dependent Lhr-like helicase
MSSAFSRLQPRLQAAIVSRLGWASLRLVQELSIPSVLDGINAIILAPTAGGKTEAAMFPVISQLMERTTGGVGALYIAPIKALLNNQADRLGTYTEMVGLRRFVWHGDVTTSERGQFLAEPTDLLMTTPESLEVMLASQKVDPRALLGNVQVIVIDEIHAMAGSDRGAHLMSVIERIAALGQRDIQRIGLSATVGNPAELMTWLQGSSRRPAVVIDPPKVPSKRELLVIHRETLSALAADAAVTARGRKTLFFCQSRKMSEAVADAIRACGTEVFVHHGSVSKEERLLAEERFHHGKDACIVCTSTLELGIDVGDLDRVLQAEAPDTVGSFLQRMGRTGRRAGQAANATFFCEDVDSVVQAYALIELAKRGWVESVHVNRRSWPVLVHQLLAMSLSRDGITAEAAWAHFARVPDFADIHRAEYDRLVAWLIKDGALRVASGRLVMGPKAESRFGRRNFMELYAVFSSPQSYTVQHGEQPIGTLGQAFVDRLVEGVSTFLLAGRAWLVDGIRHGDRVIRASPAPRGTQPTWGGITPSFLGFELCQEIRRILGDDAVGGFLSPTAAAVLAARRDALGEVARSADGIEETDDGLRWWTFAGGRINATLKHALAAVGGDWKITTDNLGLTVRGALRSELTEARARLREPEFWEDERLWNEVAGGLPGYRLSKFQILMPKWVEQEMLATFLLDIEGTWRWLSGGGVVERPPRRPQAVDAPVESARLVPAAEPMLPADVAWVATTEALAEAAREWAEADAIGFDVETTLGSRTLCLIQVSDGQRTWFVDPFAVGGLEPLGAVLSAQKPVKIIHNAPFKRSVMAKHGIAIDGVFDTLSESRRRTPVSEGGHSLRAVCDRELGITMEKTEQTRDWARRPLTEAQLRSAALDASVLVALWRRWAPTANGPLFAERRD